MTKQIQIYQNDTFRSGSKHYLVRLWFNWRTGELRTLQLINQSTGESRDYTEAEFMALLRDGRITKTGNIPTEQAERLLSELQAAKGSLNDADVQEAINLIMNRRAAA